jgi:hypothetical protein
MSRKLRVIAPHPKQPAAAKKTAKPEPRLLVHVALGQGVLLGVRELDSGTTVASVRFDDGSERILQLQQQYWLTDLTGLISAPTKPSRRQVPEPRLVEADASKSADDEEGETEEAEEHDEEHECDADDDEDDGDADPETEDGDDEDNGETDPEAV